MLETTKRNDKCLFEKQTKKIEEEKNVHNSKLDDMEKSTHKYFLPLLLKLIVFFLTHPNTVVEIILCPFDTP